MKSSIAILFTVLGFVLLAPLPALAIDPECENLGAQAQTLDFSNGVGHICLPAKDVTGTALPDVKVITCSVTFTDGSGAVISTQEVVGGPGQFLPLTVPSDGVGSASASCTMDTQVSESVNVTVVFPANTSPAPPVIVN